MVQRKKKPSPELKRDKGLIVRVKKGDSLKTIYAKVRKSFTAADLQRFTEIEPGIPGRQVLAELVALDRAAKHRAKKKPKDGRPR